MYQLLLCVMQTVVTLYMTKILGVRFPAEGLFTPWFLLDFGITMFLITYASDMMSLFISALCHSTTTAMTIMPFVLIFQLVFSGGFFSLSGCCKAGLIAYDFLSRNQCHVCTGGYQQTAICRSAEYAEKCKKR